MEETQATVISVGGEPITLEIVTGNMESSSRIGDLVAAIAKAQLEFGTIKRSEEGTIKGTAKASGKDYEYSYKYADLADNLTACRPALNRQGIALLQFPRVDLQRQTVSVRTALHLGEQFVALTIEASGVGRSGFNIQSIGAAITYLRRYGVQALAALASEDDDGQDLGQVDNKPVIRGAPGPKKKGSAPHPDDYVAGEPASEPTAAPAAEAPKSVRSTFLVKSKERGWGLADIKAYMKLVFPDAKSTANLTEKQLSDTLEAFGQVKPEEFFVAPDGRDKCLPLEDAEPI